jgi:Tfp pilus assembly PilM family ATPase
LAVTDDGLYLTVFSNATKQAFLNKKVAFDGLNAENISKGLKKLKSQLKVDFSFAVVSLPPVDNFTALFEFPLIAEGKQIEEAMNLAVSTLPVPESEIYSDWMPLENARTRKKEAVLTMAKKNSIDSYLKIFNENKIAPVAIENYAWSLGQFLEEGDDVVMIVAEQFDSVIFIVYDGKIPYFHFDLPKEIFNNEDDFLKASVQFTKRLAHFVSSENNRSREVKSIIVLGGEELKSAIKENISGVAFGRIAQDNIPSELGFFVSLGAA